MAGHLPTFLQKQEPAFPGQSLSVWEIILAPVSLSLLTGRGVSLLASHSFFGVHFLSLLTASFTPATMYYDKSEAHCCVGESTYL